jgi:hypothetical protein
MRSRAKAAATVAILMSLQACALVQYRPDVAIGTGKPGGVYFVYPLGKPDQSSSTGIRAR